MNKKPENNIDEILDNVKNTPIPEGTFKSTEDFKAEFFSKVNECERKRSSFASVCKWGTFATAAAATVVVGVNFLAPSISQTFAVLGTAAVGGRYETSASMVVDSAATAHTSHSERKSSAIHADAAWSGVCASPAGEWDGGSSGAVPSYSPRNVVSLSRPEPEMPRIERLINTEEYKAVTEKGFVRVLNNPLSTFGADVDTASFTNLRRYLINSHAMPPRDLVRIEELLNYFRYDYPAPQNNDRFNVHFESMDAPWAPERKLLLAGVQAKTIAKEELPPSNFVFLIDNSGSMYDELPLVIEAMDTLAGQLRPCDRVSVVTYGGNVSVLLNGRSGKDKELIKSQIRALRAGGYTSGGAGIQTAYKLAHRNFIKGGNNRIVMITDGDFNVGISSESALVSMVEKERQSGIYMSTFGVGSGNYKDNKLKMLANKGNGNYSYLDSIREARRVMTKEMSGKMFTLGKDVKFQLEFNPAKVAAYRLIGYELRELAARDFNDDSKDAGEVGVGHQVTALYELIMTDAKADVKEQYLGSVDALKYQKHNVGTSDEILSFKLRYQKPEGKNPSTLQSFSVKALPESSANIQWASAVAEFGMLLRNSEFKGNADYSQLRRRAQKYLGADADGKRAEFLTMVKAAEELADR